ncbi:unc-93-like protein a [Plakobranchus ocellatus]|uniref:Unc-93-like protein a n=1 Tax=Plakobranchus ocellatus TaxID=259542 RepID=A0AAV4BCH6_9GAST|nr:unc-93-like protein a [Plakobranchus ocellatus]
MHKFIRVRTGSTRSSSATAGGSHSGGETHGSGSNRYNNNHNTSNNNGMGPFGMSGLGMGFGLYRPRRPSYTLATQSHRQRSESYRHATRPDNGDLASDADMLDGEDYIDGVIKRSSRKASLVKCSTEGSEEGDEEEGLRCVAHERGHDDDEDDDVIVTTAAVAAVSRARTPEARTVADVLVASEDEDPATSISCLTERSCSEQLALESTKPAESVCPPRIVPNHLALHNSHHCLSNVADQLPHTSPNGNGTSPGVGTPFCEYRGSDSFHNDLAHAIPLPPEAIYRKRKTLARSLACGVGDKDEYEQATAATTTTTTTTTTATTIVSVPTSITATPDSHDNNALGKETVVVGVFTPVNGRVASQGGNSISSKTNSFLQRLEKFKQNKNNVPGISTCSFTKNLIILCLGFIFVYSSFRAIQNLQSSLHGSQNLGVITMTVVHISMVVASLLAPIIVNVFTAKWAMCGGVMCFIAWFSAHAHPTFWSLVPTSVLVGLGQAVLWNVESSYVLKLAMDSAAVTRRGNMDQEMFRFHGFFLACFQSTHIWGNLISSLMLSWYKNELLQAQASGPGRGIPIGSGIVGQGGDYSSSGTDLNGHGNSIGLQIENGSASSSNDLHTEVGQGTGDMEDYEVFTIPPFCGTLHRCTQGQDSLLRDIYPGKYLQL